MQQLRTMILFIATRNAHKVQEIRAMLGRKWHYLSLADLERGPALIEDGVTFEENARKKAVGVAKWICASPKTVLKDEAPAYLYILSDDSGLEVDALKGAPGIHSARFAALDSDSPGNSPDSANNAKLLKLLEGVGAEQRTGRFRCVIAITKIPFSQLTKKPLLYTENSFVEHTKTFEGVCKGKIAFGPSGKRGFGYDPLFIPSDHEKSFAELGDHVKNKISHRAKAMEKLREYLAAETVHLGNE
jgi:XTP/dITP diphosphohydrolase